VYTSECQIAELPTTSTWASATATSQLVMVMRGSGVASNGSIVGVGRYLAWSVDGGRNFGNCSLSSDLMPATNCEGSLASSWRGFGGPQAVLYTSLPSTSSFRPHGRLFPSANLSIFRSATGGHSWTRVASLWPGSSEYSSLTVANGAL